VPVPCAILHAGTLTTHYRRAGSGPPVLLLARRRDAAVRDALLAALTPRYRVYVPTIPRAARSDVPRWLVLFCEGLGVEPAGVIAVGGLARAALAHATLAPWQVTRLVLVDAPRDAATRAVLPAERVAGPALPVLRLRGTPVALDLLHRFLAGDGGTAAR
jgi:pimeloyl-ACP methyl ester carboxylesterase